jgi:hypothetical protein
VIHRLIGGVLLGALALSACSDDTDPDTTPPTTIAVAETTSTTMLPDPEPIGDAMDLDRTLPPETDVETLGPLGSTETTIPTVEGEISIGGGEVPGSAGDFPVPDGLEILITTETADALGFTGRVDGELDDLVGFYEEMLPGAGYEITDRTATPGVFTRLLLDGPLTGDVVISGEPGGSGWTVAVALAAVTAP